MKLEKINPELLKAKKIIIYDEATAINWKSKKIRLLADVLKEYYGKQIILVRSSDEFIKALRN